jgi:hypothetical protein
MTEWTYAFLEQAKSDLRTADALADSVEYSSQATMLLQMAWEKLAKAALISGRGWDPTHRTHAVAVKFVSALKRAPNAPSVLFSGPRQQFVARMSTLQADLVALEKLTPALSDGGMNAEYPWSQNDAAGNETILWPAKHLTRRFSQPGRSAIRIRRDFTSIASNFDRIFV